MTSVEIKQRQVVVGKEKIPLLSGEMHYWRMHAANWDQALSQCKSMGINVIATYIPWFYHEYQRGKFDFTGKTDPSRNLRGFLQLLKKRKFWVIIRPGPYIYSECPNDGVPDYAYKYHRLHPTFLKYASVYLEKVCAVIREFQATKTGGNIILLQSDNEIDPWPDLFGHQYGLGAKPGLFQEFIANKYDDDIGALNDAWGSSYASFKDVGPYVVHYIKGDDGLRRYLDYFDFKYFYSREVARWGIAEYKKHGITVPIYLNLYPFLHVHDWVQMEEECDLTGIDLYPENEFSADLHDHRKFMDKIRYTCTYSALPYIAEFASGVWHNHHYATGVLSPNHYRLISLSALAAGVCGWNWYMLVNRENWYMAPINESGRPRPELTHAFSQIVNLFNAIKPYACKKITDIAVTFNSLQYAAKTVPHDDLINTSLYSADIDYDVVDAHRVSTDKKVLFYSGNQWLSEDGQKRLLSYVEKGGTLVCFRNYPRRNNRFEPCNVLGFNDPAKILFEFKRKCTIRFCASCEITTWSSVYVFDDVPGTKFFADVEGGGRYAVGYERTIGKGKIVHVGLDAQPEVLFAILCYLKTEPPVSSQTAFIHTTLLQRKNKYYLIVINNGEERRTALISLRHSAFRNASFYVKDIETQRHDIVHASADPVLTVDVERKNGKVLELGVQAKGGIKCRRKDRGR